MAKQVSFDTKRAEALAIHAIAVRAARMAATNGWVYPLMDADMDITACHCNGNPLRLNDLLAADDANFAHDVFGIYRHIDRETGALKNCFSPRYSVPAQRAA